ncbi:MAG: hypothetical protein JWO02_4210, partial [Solirubrobacterales bacterium]|nr:hypothetical protein [Solirubrobacterales bacterium]
VEDSGVDVVVLPDHHIRILAATGSTGSSTRDGAIVGLMPDGTRDTAFGAADGVADGIVTFAGAFSPDIPAAIAAAPDGRLAVTGDVARNGNDDTFVSMFNADGTPNTAFGATGTVMVDRSGYTSADAGVDIAFRPGGGVVVLVQLGPASSATSALHAFTDSGGDDTAFASNGDLPLAVGDAPTLPTALLVYAGRLWVTGSTRTGADTTAFLARAEADGSGLQSRQFDMRGQLIDPSLAVTSAGEAMTIVPGVSGGPDTLVVAGSVTSTSSTDWAAAAFNGLDGNLADAGFGDIAIQTPGSAGLTGVSAGQGWVAITGPYQDTVTTPTSQSTYTRFGDARLLLGGGLPPVVPDPNAGKTCNLALSVTRPLELTLPWTQTAPVTFQVANNGTLACGGSISVSGSYGLTDNGVAGPIATGPVAPGTSFTSAAARLGFLGGLRPEDTATFTLAATGDTDLIDNLAALHVRFSYCDLGVAAASRPSFVPSEGTLDFSLTVRDAGTATCGGVRVAVSGAGRRATTEKAYSVDAGHDVADEVAAGVRKPVKAGSKVKMIFGVAHAGDPVASNNSVTISPRLLDVGDTNATRPAGSAATLRGAASPGRGPAKAKLLRVTRVSVAVRRLGGGCRWLASTHGGFRTKHVAAKASCAPTWLTAHGTTRWTLPTGGLPAGQYELLSRATIGAGFREDSFTTKDRNRVLFTVR